MDSQSFEMQQQEQWISLNLYSHIAQICLTSPPPETRLCWCMCEVIKMCHNTSVHICEKIYMYAYSIYKCKCAFSMNNFDFHAIYDLYVCFWATAKKRKDTKTFFAFIHSIIIHAFHRITYRIYFIVFYKFLWQSTSRSINFYPSTLRKNVLNCMPFKDIQ